MDGIWDGSSNGTMVSLTAATGSRCFGYVSPAFKGWGNGAISLIFKGMLGLWWFSLEEASFLLSLLEFF